MEPTFIQDYLLYNSGNECPRRYHIWSAHFLLAATAGRKVYLNRGYTTLYPELYLTLVGTQGNRKTTAKDIARDMYVEVNPDSPLGANVQSREKIMELLASTDGIRTYTDEKGEVVECHPMTFFINELKNFLSINPTGMIEFLTDIYGQKYFRNSTLKHGEQVVPNPCINILACETPEWIQEKLKLRILSGGFARRMIYVYETEMGELIAFPGPTPEGTAARERCLNHLKKVKAMVGPFKWDPEAEKYFDLWYRTKKVPDDPIMRGYYTSKHDQLLKVAMGLCLAEKEPKLLITVPHLELGLATLDSIEDNLPKLSIAAGRNELAIPQQQLLDLIEKHGGWWPYNWVLRDTASNLQPMEQETVIRFLKTTEALFEAKIPFAINGSGEWIPGGIERRTLMTKVRLMKCIEQKIIQTKPPSSLPS